MSRGDDEGVASWRLEEVWWVLKKTGFGASSVRFEDEWR